MAKEKWEQEDVGSMENEYENRAGENRDNSEYRQNQEGDAPGMEARNLEEETAKENWEEGSETASSRGYGSAAQLQQYLRGVKYPADKQDMIEAARSNSAPDDIMSLMNKLPDRTYNAPAEVEEEFGKIR